MRHKLASLLLAAFALASPYKEVNACTGITLSTTDNTKILARTIEWGGSDLNSQYVIVPRGYTQQSYVPGGTDGMRFTAQYGYVGLAVEQKEFIAEGLNEAGLSAGLFYFPNYGQYEDYDPAQKASSIADLQLVSWILGKCKTVDEVKEAVASIHVIRSINRPLALLRSFRPSDRARDRGWQGAILRERAGCLNELSGFRMADDQSE